MMAACRKCFHIAVTTGIAYHQKQVLKTPLSTAETAPVRPCGFFMPIGFCRVCG